MKKQLFSLVAILTSLFSNSQTAVSINNGNWTNPLTWNCTCVPLMGHSVTINHSVTLNTSMSFTSGGITINNSGALIQDASLNKDIWINGGYFNNNGRANFRYFLITNGTAYNAGTFTVSAFSNSVSFSNSGSLTMDSMYISGNFTNTPTGKLLGDSLTNASSLVNNGFMNVTWVTNNSNFTNNNYQAGYAFTNDGIYNNFDSLILSGSLWNKNIFNNKFGAKFNMTKNFHNYNPSKTAVFDNNGNVNVFDSWYNTDTVRGSNTGYFTVSDTSANSGFMKGNFGFCDLTPPTSAPYIDFNSGSIDNGITWCNPLGINEYVSNIQFKIYPNPNSGNFVVKSEEEDILILMDELGRIMQSIELNSRNKFSTNISHLENGVYFLKGKTITKKIVVVN